MIHSFDSEVAKEYGLVEAILLQNIAFWIAKNEANERNFYDGDYWTYNSIKAFKELFPYLTEKKIRGALDRLIDSGIIKAGNYNSNRLDRSLWYAFTEKGKCICTKGQMHISERANAFVQKGKCINTDNKQQIINTDNNSKHPYGEFGNVLLTEEEHQKLTDKGLLPYIERLSSYIASTGKKYKSHYATILNWSRKDEKETPKETPKGKLKSKPTYDINSIQARSESGADIEKLLEELG